MGQQRKLGRGLAVSAVSALAITGLTVTAPPALADAGSGVLLLSQADGVASVRLDRDAPFSGGVTLAAEQLDPTATISFQYNADPDAGDAAEGWVGIGQPTTTEAPYLTTEWFPDGVLVGTSVALRAVATNADDPVTYSTRHDVALSGDEPPVDAVSFESVDGFFTQPYVDSSRTSRLLRVNGTTSATDGSVELSAWYAGNGSFQGQTDAEVSLNPLKVTSGVDATYIDGGYFSGGIDISGFDAGDGDTLAVRAERDSDDFVAARLLAQTILAIEPTPDPLHAGSQGTVVTLRVLDQRGGRIVGAEVRRSSNGALVGYTDGEGQVTVTQANDTNESYYANTTDTDAFEEGIDVVTGPVQTPAYEPVATATSAVFADGAVFDDQEYADGDIALQVLDQEGTPFAGEEELSYTLYRTGQEPPTPTVEMTDTNGRLIVPFDPSEADGEYTLTFTAPDSAGGADQQPVTFVAGDAALGLTPLQGAAASGGQITYSGALTVAGEPLPGRTIDLGYTRGTEAAPGTDADAALVIEEERTLEGAVTTGTDGTFAVTVDDLAETGSPVETGGKLRVTARGLEDSVDATADFLRVASSTKAVLADGAVFDDREYVAGDITLQVVDQQGTPIAGAEQLGYRLTRTGQEPPPYTVATTDANGRLVVPFDPTGADGEYTLTFTAPDSAGGADQQPVTFVAGDAVLGLTPVQGKAASGGQITYSGALTVAGEPLPGRTIDLGYTRGTELARGKDADSALVIGGARRLTGAVATGADGTFAVTVDDLAESGRPTETGGKLRVTARGLQDSVAATADFGAGKSTAKLRLAGSGRGAHADRLRVNGPISVAGEKVRILAKSGSGRWRLVKGLKLNRNGDTSLTVRDRNGTKTTRYYAQLLSSLRVTGSKSNVRRLR